MAWNTDETKRRLKQAAVEEFSSFGLAGARVDRIAERAGINKERIYGYFGNKEQLFATVLRDELSQAAEAVPMAMKTSEDIAQIAGHAFDYHEAHLHFARLLHWEALAYGENPVPDEQGRGQYYQDKVSAFSAAQDRALIASTPDADQLVFMVLALAAWWFAVPQVARMLSGPITDPQAERARRRAAVVEAARRLADPAHETPAGLDRRVKRAPVGVRRDADAGEQVLA